MVGALAMASAASADDKPASDPPTSGAPAKQLVWRPARPNQAEWLAEMNQQAALKANDELAGAKDTSEDSNSRTRPKTPIAWRRHDSGVTQAQKADDSPFGDPFNNQNKKPAATDTPTAPRATAPLDTDTGAPAPKPLKSVEPRRVPANVNGGNPFGDEEPMPKTNSGRPPRSTPSPSANPATTLPPQEPSNQFRATQSGRTPILPSASSVDCSQDGAACDQELANLMHNTIDKISLDVSVPGKIGDAFPCECTLGDLKFVPRDWPCITYTWKASALCHKPLYFEETQLERYGHSRGPILDPFVSVAHFFVSVPLLPYKMGVELPFECEYSLGYYRPGSCAPWMIEPVPLSLRGALFEGGAAAGTALIITP